MSSLVKIFFLTIFLSVQLNAFLFPLLMVLSSKEMTPEEKKESYIYNSIEDIDEHLKKYFDILTWKNYPNENIKLDRSYVDAEISKSLSLTFTLSRDTFSIKNNPQLEKEIINNLIENLNNIFINRKIKKDISKIIYIGNYDKDILKRINKILKITEEIVIDEEEFLKTDNIDEVDKYNNIKYKKIPERRDKYNVFITNTKIEKEAKENISVGNIEVKDFSTKKDPF